MVKASDLVKKQKELDKIKYKTFTKIYNKIEEKIKQASNLNFYYIWFEIPEFLIGFSLYNFKECRKCIIDKLKDDGFKVEKYEPNIILISWFVEENNI